jgi:hypothetical protein
MALKSKGGAEEAGQPAPSLDTPAESEAVEVKEAEKPKKPEKAEAKEAREQAAVQVPKVFVFKHKMPIDGSLGVYVNGDEISVNARKGVIEFTPETFAQGLKIRDALVGNGWEDETVYPVNRPIDAPKPVIRAGKKWFFHHPDASAMDAINCNIGFYVNDQEVSVEVRDSKCVVESVELATALEKHGYICDHIEFE